MASEKTDALVLRLIEWSESSLIVTLLTRDYGKTVAVAKGARRPKSSFEGALDLLAVCRVVIIQKSGETLDLLTEAKLDRRFRAGARDLERLYAGYYVAELLRELTDLGDPHPELFDLANRTLQLFDGDTDVRACLLRFELQMLRFLGHAPSLEACSGCGDALVANDLVAFGLLSGGVLCDACRITNRGIVLMQIESLRWMLNSTGTEALDKVPQALPARSYGEIRGLMNRYMADLCGGPLRLSSYLPAGSARTPTFQG